MEAKAPALPSSVTCQVNASPRAFSLSISLLDLGNEFFHKSNIRGRRPRTTPTPKVMMEPMMSQPACVLWRDSLEF